MQGDAFLPHLFRRGMKRGEQRRFLPTVGRKFRKRVCTVYPVWKVPVEQGEAFVVR